MKFTAVHNCRRATVSADALQVLQIDGHFVCRFCARCNIYISRLCYTMSVSVCLWPKCIVVTVHAGKREGSSRAMLAAARPSCLLCLHDGCEVSQSACSSVCMSAHSYFSNATFLNLVNLLYVSHVNVARSSCDDNIVRYVLPVLWMPHVMMFSHNRAVVETETGCKVKKSKPSIAACNTPQRYGNSRAI